MKSYVSLTIITLKLALREKVVLFFNFLFPLIFFFVFGEMMDAGLGGLGVRVVSMVLVLGVLGNGLFGAGVRAVVDRETNILRRYKVTPISPAPILVASIVTGWILYLPTALLILGLAKAFWGVEFPDQWPALLAILSAGVWAMRAIGLIIASVVNTAAESNILIQLLYMPMLFLSGATFPLSALPEWAQIVSQFLPATYLHNGMERILIRGEGLAENLAPLSALLLCTLVATFLSVKIFRWEKEQAMPARAKLLLLLAGLPFIGLGVQQVYSGENIEEAKALDRELSRNRTRLIRGARIFIGDGSVIESGGLLIRNGRIAEVYEGDAPAPESLDAEVIEGAGKTVLPGLIDMDVRLAETGGAPPPKGANSREALMERALAAYLYSGVTAVRSASGPLDAALAIRGRIRRAVRLGAELFVYGLVFTSEGDPGREYVDGGAAASLAVPEHATLRRPRSSEEARRVARELAGRGVDGIYAVLGAGRAGSKEDESVLRAIADECRVLGLPLVAQAGDAPNAAEAAEAGAAGVVAGPFRELMTEESFSKLKASGAAFMPALVAAEARVQLAEGRFDLLSQSLARQVALPGTIEAARAAATRWSRDDGAVGSAGADFASAKENLRRAYEAGLFLAAGTGSGRPLLIHGPAIHRELQLWVNAGIPPAAALAAATFRGAELLGASDRIGLIRRGYEASLLLVDGNPLEDISATEHISAVFFKGQRVHRPDLFAGE